MKIVKLMIGVALIIGGGILEVIWLGLCFGSVIIGIVLLIFAPHILFLPWTMGMILGAAFIESAG